MTNDKPLLLRGFFNYCMVTSKFFYIMELKMKRYMAVIFGFSLLFWSHSVMAQTNPVPDVTNWKVVNTSRIELRISDCASIYLGLETEYSNPTVPGDFVRIVSRHIPVTVSKCRDFNERLASETVAEEYSRQEEQDLLNERTKQSDPFLYLEWKTDKDPVTGHDRLSSDVLLGIMAPDGNWLVTKNEKALVEFMTENVGNGKTRNIFSGAEFRVGGIYHILRANRSDIIRLLEGGR